MKVLYKSLSWTGGDRLIWRMGSSRLRILCYHGVCEDRLAGEPWMRSDFVTRSAFRRQLSFLARHAAVLPLREAVHRLASDSLPPNSVCLTFDDGYANNLEQAYPELARFGLPATVFLATSFIESGEFFPFVKLKLVRRAMAGKRHHLPEYKTSPSDSIANCLEALWPGVAAGLNDEQRRVLRPITPSELRAADRSVFDFGAHTHTHCILGNEQPDRRRWEVLRSLDKVAGWTGQPARLFSYPNGCRGDFGSTDVQTLRDAGVEAAVTGIAGANGRKADPLMLRRYPVGLFHDPAGFAAEVTGVRTAMLGMLGKAAR